MRAQGWNVGLLTLTAPGDPGHASTNWVGGPYGEPDCSCARALTDPGLWNASAGHRWNHLRTVIRRRYPDFEFSKVTEFQDGKRGGQARMLIHFHIVCAYTGTLDLQWIRDQAINAGFSCGTQWEPDVNPAYLAKYVSKGSEQRHRVPWTQLGLDETTGDLDALVPVVNPRIRMRSSSHSWPVTMKAIIDTNRAQQRARAAALRDPGNPPAEGAEAPQAGAPTVGEHPPP